MNDGPYSEWNNFKDVKESVEMMHESKRIFVEDEKNGTDNGLGEWIDIFGRYDTHEYIVIITEDGFDVVVWVNSNPKDEYYLTFIDVDSDKMTEKLVQTMDRMTKKA